MGDPALELADVTANPIAEDAEPSAEDELRRSMSNRDNYERALARNLLSSSGANIQDWGISMQAAGDIDTHTRA